MKKINELLDSFPAKIDYVRRASMGVPKMFIINLALPITDQIYNLAGNLFYIWEAPDQTSLINIKVNNTGEPGVPYTLHTGAITPFDKLLITTPAGQAGNMTIIYATEAPELLQLIDNRSALSLDLAAIREELQGDVTPEAFIGITITAAPGATLIMAARAARKGCCIQALSTNTGSVFLGFANTVTVGGAPGIWFAELQAGDSMTLDDYRGPIYGIATAQQIVGTGEW